MKKLISAILLSVFCVTLFSSCGHIASLRTLKMQARQNGKCKYLRCDEDENSRTAYFEDELGFEYHITSYMNDISIDGASFGSVPTTTSNYESEYFKCLCGKANEAEPDCTAKFGEVDEYSQIKIYADQNDMSESVVTIGKAFKMLEKRKEYTNSTIPVYDKNDTSEYPEQIAAFGYENEVFLDKTAADAQYYLDRINDYSNMYYRKSAKPSYSRHEHKRLEDVPDITDDKLSTLLGKPDPKVEGVEVYYFTIDGDEYFITNVLIYDKSYQNTFFYNNYITDPYDR